MQKEIETCTMVAEKYPKNYYAWTHRYVCLQNLWQLWKDQNPNTSFYFKMHEFFQNEMNFIPMWMKNHISDHSCIHYGIQCMHLFLQLGTSNGGYCDIHHISSIHWSWMVISKAMEQNKQMIQVPIYSIHESVWKYRRLCSLLILPLLTENHTTDHDSIIHFIQQELHDAYHNSIASQTHSILSQEETNRVQIFSKSYFLWLYYHLQQMNDKNEYFSNLIQNIPTLHDVSNLWKQLENDSSIVHNFWRKTPFFGNH